MWASTVSVPGARSPGACGLSRPERRSIVAVEIERSVDSIESAHDYMDILATTTQEVMSELKRDRDLALRDGELRRTQAID